MTTNAQKPTQVSIFEFMKYAITQLSLDFDNTEVENKLLAVEAFLRDKPDSDASVLGSLFADEEKALLARLMVDAGLMSNASEEELRLLKLMIRPSATDKRLSQALNEVLTDSRMLELIGVPSAKIMKKQIADIRKGGAIGVVAFYLYDEAQKTYYGVYSNQSVFGTTEIVVRKRWSDTQIMLKDQFMDKTAPQLMAIPTRTNKMAELDAALTSFMERTGWITNLEIYR